VGIPYPPGAEHNNPASLLEHPSQTFLDAFTKAQIISNVRLTRGDIWPLFEFKEDLVKPLRQIVDGFTEPIIAEALEKRERRLAKNINVEDNEVDNLLSHLVNSTQGQFIILHTHSRL